MDLMMIFFKRLLIITGLLGTFLFQNTSMAKEVPTRKTYEKNFKLVVKALDRICEYPLIVHARSIKTVDDMCQYGAPLLAYYEKCGESSTAHFIVDGLVENKQAFLKEIYLELDILFSVLEDSIYTALCTYPVADKKGKCTIWDDHKGYVFSANDPLIISMKKEMHRVCDTAEKIKKLMSIIDMYKRHQKITAACCYVRMI
jgi:hypothetical protein